MSETKRENKGSFSSNESCSHSTLFNKEFCAKCGCIVNHSFSCAKHPKYIYQIEINPKKIFQSMISSSSMRNKLSLTNVNTTYLSMRKDIISKIKKIATKLNFKSQTFFLSLLYIDTIFQNSNISLCTSSTILLTSLSCLVIAAKFIENDCTLPDLPVFVQYFNIYTNCMTNVDMLRASEVEALIHLNYKLNRYTVYDYVSFFFCHGVAMKGDMKSKRTLEKIYVYARDLIDKYIYSDEYLKYYEESAYIAFVILNKSIEDNIKTTIKYSDIIKKVFHIDIEKKEACVSIEKDICNIEKGTTKETKKTLQCSASLGKLFNNPPMASNNTDKYNYYKDQRRAISSFKREMLIENKNKYPISNNNIYARHSKMSSTDLLNKTKNLFYNNEKNMSRYNKPNTIIINNININVNPINDNTARSSYHHRFNYGNNMTSKYHKFYNYY